MKNRNGKVLTEAEDITKRWQEYTEKTVQKDIIMTQTTMMVWSLTRARHPRNVKSSGP